MSAAAKLTTQYVTLALPVSVNRMYKYTGRGVFLTPEAVAYKTRAGWTCRACQIVPFAGRVAMELRFYRSSQKADLDNLQKLLLDSLIGHAYHDDKQVVEIHAYRRDDRNNPRVEVTIWEVN